MFKLVNGSNPIAIHWAPIDTTVGTSLYVGQPCMNCTGSTNGLTPLAVASGASDVSGDQCIYGIIVGTNDETPTYIATYGQYLLGTNTTGTLQKARKFFGAEGMYAKGDPQGLVRVAKITAETILEADIYNATVGVAPTVVTSTAVTNATGGMTGFTTGSIDVATVANMCTFYCRSGANAGLYRVAKSASSTTHTFDTSWPYAGATTDTYVCVPYRVGLSFAQITATSGYLGMGLDCSQTAATNYFAINVIDMKLSVAGKEVVRFTFSPAHFQGVRA